MTKIADAYSAWSACYDTDRNYTRDLDRDVTRRLLGDRRISVVVEAGCGTGKNTLQFAQIADRVHALDFSAGMLDIAARRVTAPNVTFAEADLARAWPCADASAELVSFNLVLEHIEHLDEPLREAARVLRADGRLLISELHPYRQIVGSQAHFHGADGAEVRVPAFLHHVSDYVRASRSLALRVLALDEWWHDEDDRSGPPRLLSLVFGKTVAHPLGEAMSTGTRS